MIFILKIDFRCAGLNLVIWFAVVSTRAVFDFSLLFQGVACLMSSGIELALGNNYAKINEFMTGSALPRGRQNKIISEEEY